jgi:hypothetical protein
MKPLLMILILLSISGCQKGSWKIVELNSPAGPASGEPFLVAANDEVWMSWLEKTSSGHALKLARWNGEWSKPNVIVSGVPFFVNWADFPSILLLANNRVVSHWLQKAGNSTYAYHVMLSISEDQGKTWTQPITAHTDTSANEHGFASLVDEGTGNFSIVWLDGRNFKAEHDSSSEMALMFSKHFRNESTLDSRVCDCCQTAAVRTRNGIFVAYRDRSEKEIRDISYVRFASGNWSEPKTVHDDGWQIDGCPVNGPAVETDGETVVVAWYTGAGDKGRVRVAFSQDGGVSFQKPVQVDDGNPSGRVDVVLLEDKSSVVSWLENQDDKGAAIRIRQIFPDGSTGQTLTVADTSKARSSGFPRMVRAGKDLFLAWTYTSDPPVIRLARIEM